MKTMNTSKKLQNISDAVWETDAKIRTIDSGVWPAYLIPAPERGDYRQTAPAHKVPASEREKYRVDLDSKRRSLAKDYVSTLEDIYGPDFVWDTALHGPEEALKESKWEFWHFSFVPTEPSGPIDPAPLKIDMGRPVTRETILGHIAKKYRSTHPANAWSRRVW
tara:strand:- start:936 stop:1427 length:492 start_codon:yes stop_codon:yes gene_type:complete